MDQQGSYYDFNDKNQQRAVAFLLRSLLKTKSALIDARSTIEDEDEDVNIYLAHLLFAVSTSEYHQVTDRYLSPYSVEISKMVDQAEDPYIKYFIYKVNADHLLVHLGIFQDIGDDAPRPHAIFQMDGRHHCGQATSYYDQAAQLNQRIYHRRTAVGSVLQKLSERFELYCGILKATRRDFFHFANTSTDDQFTDFVKELGSFERTALLKTKLDEFLDLYGQWLGSRDKEIRDKLQQLAEDIRQLDPDFRFEMPT